MSEEMTVEQMREHVERLTPGLRRQGHPAALELCGLLEGMLGTVQAQQDALARAQAREAGLMEALAWYGEQARLCRLIHSGGDAGRHALSADGGKRARAAAAEAGEG